MERIRKPIASALALACILSGNPAFAANVSGKVEPVPGNLGGANAVNPAEQMNTAPGMGVISGLQMPQGLSQGLMAQLAAVQAHPLEALERLKVSQALPDVALYKVLAHPEAITRQGEALAAAIGPENFQALAATAHELNKLAGQNGAVRELLSAGGNPAVALEDFKKHFDGAARRTSVVGDAGTVAVPTNFSEGATHNSGLHKPAASNRSDSAADREILSLGERIARGITRDESLKLVPWEPLWEGDRPTWRLVKEGENLRVQYVPEDLRHANKDVAMAHLMQEVFRAVYSRPDLIEPDLQSNGLFQTLYDTMETGRVVKKGVKERPGLSDNFDALNQEHYGNPAAAGGIKDLPSYLRFLEGALYESRLGREDPRVKDPRVLEVLKKTRSLRNKIASASPEEAYKLSREIWPTLQKLHEESESAAMSQKMFEKMGQEGKLGSDKEQNAAAGQGRLKLDDLNQQQREQAQKQIEKMLKEMTPEQREQLRQQIQEQMQKQEQAFRKTMGKSQADQKPGRQRIILAGLAAGRRRALPGFSLSALRPFLAALVHVPLVKTGQIAAQGRRLEVFADLVSQGIDHAADRLQIFLKPASLAGVEAAGLDFLDLVLDVAHRIGSALSARGIDFAAALFGLALGIARISGLPRIAGLLLRPRLEQLRQQANGLAQQLEQAASRLAQEAAQAKGQAQDLEERASQMRAQTGARDISSKEAEELDAQAGQLHQQADQLNQSAQEFRQMAEQLKRGASSSAADKTQEQAQQLGEMGRELQNQSEQLQKQTEALKKQLVQGQEQETSSLRQKTAGIEQTAKDISEKAGKIQEAAQEAQALAQALGEQLKDALPYYKAKIGIMKEELLPGRPKARITFLIDLSGSMGRIQGGGSLDHAARALLMALKAFRLAFKNGSGVEVRVVAYNENPQRSIIGNYMQVKDISDAVLYKVIERINEIQNTDQGDNSAERMMTQAVEDIRKDMKGHSDTTYALLHIGDGDPGADIASKIRAIYDDPTNAKIRFANLAAGPQAQDMYDKYQPYSFWASELSELGMKWAEIVEATFKKAWRGSR